MVCANIVSFVRLSYCADPTPEILSLEQSIARALQSNPRVLSAQKDVAIARAQFSQAKSLYYPRVNLNMNYVRFRNETLGLTSPDLGGVILEAPISDVSGNRSNPLANNLYLGRIDFKQTLFSGGRLHYTMQLSKTNLQSSEGAYQILKYGLEFEVKSVFARLLGTKRKIDIHRLAMDQCSRQIQSSIGLARIKLIEQRASIRKQIAELEILKSQLMMDFQMVLGMEFFSVIDIQGDLNSDVPDLDLFSLLALAKQNRPELRQTQLQAEVDRLSVDLSLAERYPVFLLGGAYELRDTERAYESTNWNTVLTMNIPLFSGFAGPARLRESRYRAERGYYERVRLEDNIEREVRLAYERLKLWQQELVARRDEMTQIKRNSREFSDSTVTIEGVLKAEISVVEAQERLFIERSELERAVGRSL